MIAAPGVHPRDLRIRDLRSRIPIAGIPVADPRLPPLVLQRNLPVVIYGVALLSVCLLSGLFAGDLLGRLIGVDANVGGVGIAMLLLVFAVDRMNRRRPLLAATREGVMFWSGIYIPIVVAMAARQNVVAALDGGWAAFFAGALAVAGGMALVPALSRIGTGPAGDDRVGADAVADDPAGGA